MAVDAVHHSTYVQVYDALLETAVVLESMLKGGSDDTGVEPHAGAAMHAVRFAATVLFPTVACQKPPPFPHAHDTQYMLELCANWRDAAMQVGEFAPEPVLRVVHGERN
ncbi:hypothetical protein GCM10010129_15730 [Streptomyces fumigatiscleroticus]|nr:hypothetical protein GCM10010129_15730 [Streptomyces fumigatiscleroticus]